ncbi:lipase family protein [Psychroserpens sp.]|uniref:lipase family protein n=1 Tax=Psychroserpens sp. TaxID=2020870 RepID=UPI001B106A38|nr:lipase family protein [Psychroserpens sp.]MBO6606418.1 lipase family protein [Psychroserpens sp.]MBO6631220.1 lipase family protein [Psychroserpens sp.]MBO6653122.1 lipase family protein [Psychroserpens sp.]MBO6680850.1 lipase family protein [Psychroserpens sp.]MBO6750192.1 lipase family protein [Psychroserpens sp.]
MSISLSCKLLCVSESAYCISTTASSGRFNPTNLNPKVTPSMQKQYDAVGWLSDPFVIVKSPVKIDPYIKIEACLVGEVSEGIIISFRGTLPPAATINSIADWIENIFYVNTVSNPYLPGEVHDGFLQAFLTMQADIQNAVQTLNPYGNKPLYITGHSKGGAMAPIAASYLKRRYNHNITNVITFAGPKPGNGDFANQYQYDFPNTTNYENYLDVVPFLPPGKLFIDLLAKFPLLPEVIKNLLLKAAAYDYEPVCTNNVQYIDSNGVIDNNPIYSNGLIRFGEILEKLTEGTPGVQQIADAHHLTCGYRYIQGVCQGTVCRS